MSADQNNEIFKIVIKCITGNEFQLEVDPIWTVEELKDIVSKKLDVPVDNFSIQSKYRELTSGTLASNEITDGSEIVLVTAVTSGWKAFKRVPDFEVLNSVSEKEMEDFLGEKTCMCLDARIGDKVVKICLKFDRLKRPAIRERKPRKRKRKCCLPKKLKSPKTCNSDKVSVTKAMNDLKKTIQSIFNFHIPEGSTIKVALKPQITVTESDGSRASGGGGDNKIELLTIIKILNEMLSDRLASTSTSTSCIRSNDSLRSREELEQKLKTQQTMETILEKLRKRKLKKQRSKPK